MRRLIALAERRNSFFLERLQFFVPNSDQFIFVDDSGRLIFLRHNISPQALISMISYLITPIGACTSTIFPIS